MPKIHAAAGLLFSCLLLACSDPAGPTPSTRSFDAAPNSNGVTIQSYEGGYQFLVFDPEQQLLVSHNARNAFPPCGQTVTETTWGEFMVLHNGNDPSLVLAFVVGDPTYITVWHSTDGSFLHARCTTPVAKGVGRVVYTDNDDFANLPNQLERANSFGFSAQGNLVGPNGTVYHYNGVVRTKWQPNSADPNDRYFVTSHLNLTPIPQ